MTTFFEFGLTHDVTKALSNMGFEEATPIQEQTIKVSLERKDLIGQAQTGTGKTAAFGVPLVEHVDTESGDIQGLVLAPTRELAVQVAEELNRIGEFKGVQALPVYGGQDIQQQIKALKRKPQIVVATPGRFMDHMRRKTIRLHSINMVVLDEADEMLNMGFVEDIELILGEIPDQRQTLLFSATMPKKIQHLAQKFMNDPQTIAIKPKELAINNIEQEYIEVQEKKKFDVLNRLIDIHSPELAIVFGRTKRRVDELAEGLNRRGYSAEGTHGDLTQAKRDAVLRKFKNKTIDVLVATDVAARGLDISGVTHVFNFDIPQDPESYVHRIGRTGRAGKTGMAITFVTPREITHLKTIEEVTKRNIPRRAIPTFSEAIEGQQRIAVEKLLHIVEHENHQEYRVMAEQLLDDTDSVTLVSAALKSLTKEPDTTPVNLTGEAPVRVRKNQKNDHKKKDHKHRGGKGGGRGPRRNNERNNERGKQRGPVDFKKKRKN
ncbi:DEAD/DEAH box helicase [Texcoconibacillus texcoconensis]|uniref:ATP-dependent RNA helicase CshA n=1 Tax=Texcoconibacillus texcoconensis TaxID=1095777 RepID=A0A840QQV3_9BACI|nr:DEAD/DEAH box helicase [Texcoconibacillus texcoconensis]MBB5173718.1 ATP-dependent RNA helicase DeaD [Texcoconibacillus texcoconensis]